MGSILKSIQFVAGAIAFAITFTRPRGFGLKRLLPGVPCEKIMRYLDVELPPVYRRICQLAPLVAVLVILSYE